jgi:NitT/TauT family transport system substrate-binding protein
MKHVSVLYGVLTLLVACGAPAPAAPAAGGQPAGAATPAPAAPSQPLALRSALVSKTALAWPLLIAQSKGLFAEERVAPDVVYISTAANLVQQLGAGSLDAGQVDSAAMIRAAEKGAPVQFVAGGISAALYRLMAQPEVKTAADLRGKTVTVDSPTGQPKYMTQLLLRGLGLADNDYSFVFSGSTTDRYAQLRSGAVAAAILTQPIDLRAEDEGYTMLGDIADVLSPWFFNAIEVNTDWARRNEEAVVRYIRAQARAADLLYRNRADAVDVLVKATEVPVAEAEKTYDLYMRHKAVPERLAISDEAIERVLAWMVEIDEFKQAPPPSKYVDRTYWEKATRGLPAN